MALHAHLLKSIPLLPASPTATPALTRRPAVTSALLSACPQHPRPHLPAHNAPGLICPIDTHSPSTSPSLHPTSQAIAATGLIDDAATALAKAHSYVDKSQVGTQSWYCGNCCFKCYTDPLLHPPRAWCLLLVHLSVATAEIHRNGGGSGVCPGCR